MASNTPDSMEGPGRKTGWPIGWIAVSWVLVGLVAYGFATWLNRSDAPAPAAAQSSTKAVATAPAPVAVPTASPTAAAITPTPSPAPALRETTPPTVQAATPEPVLPRTAAPAPTAQAPASIPVVKCVINGVVTFTDEPCSAVATGKPKTGGQQMAAGPARIERKTTCEGHEEEIRKIDLQAGTTQNASELEGLALRRKQHRDEQFRMRC